MCGNRLGGGTIRDVASVRAIPRVRVTAEWTTHDDRPLRRNTLYTAPHSATATAAAAASSRLRGRPLCGTTTAAWSGVGAIALVILAFVRCRRSTCA
ncbi:hypothetical protein QTP88_010610 [Uroleucon formosanum]